jgi:hypothetical protein
MQNLKSFFAVCVWCLCAASGWAQGEIKPGFVKIRYVHVSNADLYLMETSSGIISVEHSGNADIFHLDAVGEARNLLALEYLEADGYARGRYLFNNAYGRRMEADENDYFTNEDDIAFLDKSLVTVDAIRKGNALYVLNGAEVTNVSALDDLVQAGTVRKISLDRTNNFAFSFTPVEGNQDGAVRIKSERGGGLLINEMNNQVMIDSDAGPGSMSAAFILETAEAPLPYFLPSSGTYKINNSYNGDEYLTQTGNDLYSYTSGIPFLMSFNIRSYPDVNTTLYLDAIGNGQYVIVSDYEKTEQYLRGLFLFNATELAYQNGYGSAIQDARYLFREEGTWVHLAFAEAIRVGSRLYVPGDEQVTDISQLEALVQAGKVQEIDLTADNRFAFAFRRPDDYSSWFVIQSGREASSGIGSMIIQANGVPVIGQGVFPDMMFEYFGAFYNMEPVICDVGNATVEAANIRYANGLLTVNTPAVERITVYTPAGAVMYQAQKSAGIATFNLNSLPQGILIIRGESGWVRKIVR